MNDLHKWFLKVWDEREDDNGNIYCFETGQKMNRKYYRENTAVYSHILPKHLFEKYKMEKWNVKIVMPEAHHQFSIDPEKAPKQYELYKKLLDLHNKGKL